MTSVGGLHVNPSAKRYNTRNIITLILSKHVVHIRSQVYILIILRNIRILTVLVLLIPLVDYRLTLTYTNICVWLVLIQNKIITMEYRIQLHPHKSSYRVKLLAGRNSDNQKLIPQHCAETVGE